MSLPSTKGAVGSPNTNAGQKRATAAVVVTKGGAAKTGDPKYLRPYLMVGEVLNERYEVVKEFGTGSFGHVICCRDLMNADGRNVAVKVQDRIEPKYHKDFK